MTTRGANYPRAKNDDYPTPNKTIEVILRCEEWANVICDPCCGKTRNVILAVHARKLMACGSDIIFGYDFIRHKFRWNNVDIVTNPPYGGRRGSLAVDFVKRAIQVTEPWKGKIAMLLPADFDSGGSRAEIFGKCKQFCRKIVLTDRVRWFNDTAGSTNHAWYVWDHRHKSRMIVLSYASHAYQDTRS